MKSNIDLTDNQIFSRRNIGDVQSLVVAGLYKSIFPWNIAPLWNRSGDEYDMDHQHKAIIATGDKEQRAEVRLLRQMDSGNYCDCCGRRINLIPWDKETGLCRKCDEYYQRTNPNNDKCLWRGKQNRT